MPPISVELHPKYGVHKALISFGPGGRDSELIDTSFPQFPSAASFDKETSEEKQEALEWSRAPNKPIPWQAKTMKKKGGKGAGRKRNRGGQDCNSMAIWIKADNGPLICCASSTSTRISCYEYPSMKVKRSKKPSGNYATKSLGQSPCGKYLLVNGTDRTLRVLDSATLGILQAFQDKVERSQSECCRFDRFSEYILCDSGKSHCKVNIYERHSGQLIKILEPQATILDLELHPLRAIAITCTAHGMIEIWGKIIEDKWDGKAADYAAISENEFAKADKDGQAEESKEDEPDTGALEPIDVVTMNPAESVSSDEGPGPSKRMRLTLTDYIHR